MKKNIATKYKKKKVTELRGITDISWIISGGFITQLSYNK